MEFLVASDLHFEFHADNGSSFVDSMPDAEVLVCAGDLSDSKGIESALYLLCQKFPQVVFVAGNHEFYGSTINVVKRKIRALQEGLPGLHFLDNDVVEIDGQHFVGTTMWFRNRPGLGRMHMHMNDFHVIIGATTQVYEENERALEFLAREVDDRSIVVTHHLPSEFAVDEKYKGSKLNAFFVCEMDELICEKQPPLWIHGHTHESVDVKLDQTRILCNPFGYARREINPRYDERCFITI